MEVKRNKHFFQSFLPQTSINKSFVCRNFYNHLNLGLPPHPSLLTKFGQLLNGAEPQCNSLRRWKQLSCALSVRFYLHFLSAAPYPWEQLIYISAISHLLLLLSRQYGVWAQTLLTHSPGSADTRFVCITLSSLWFIAASPRIRH